jgi:23S rRNA pseudouridine2605 synthase
MRINQFVAAASGLSRRAADTAIAGGRVRIDGRPATMGESAPDGATIELDSHPLRLPATHTYIILNKPTGYVSSRIRQGDDPTLYELLPEEYQDLRIAGRLDRDSSGLILLTDDGPFIQAHTHPSFEKHKIYKLTLARPLTPAAIRRLETGVQLTDGPSRVTILHTAGQNVTVSLSEGRNRQLRRTFGALRYTVEKLHRTKLGPYELGDLPSGQWRPAKISDTRTTHDS